MYVCTFENEMSTLNIIEGYDPQENYNNSK